MQMPSLDEVKAASRMELARWYRFLPGPGAGALDKPQKEFHEIVVKESEIIERVAKRFKELGGMSPGVSKAIGWEKP